jgi:predicted ester cyclase
MSAEENNKALVRRFLKSLYVDGDLDAIDEMLAPDFVDRSLLPGQGPSREEFKQLGVELFAAFSFADFTIEDQIVQGDKVVTKFSTRCTHRGEFLGVPPSGEVGEYSSIRIHRIVEDKIAEEWSEGNLLGVLLPSFEQEIREHERVEQELQVARRIQQASLPKEVPDLKDWQVIPYYRPAREVGGDF